MDFNRIMIGLDFSEMDQSVLKYASYMGEFLEIKKVYFVHIERTLKVDEDFMKEHGFQDLSADEKIIETMKEEVAAHFNYTGAELHFEVHEGNITEEFLHWVEIKEIDLIFVGRKKTLGGSGLIPTRIARRSAASILFVPENPNCSLNNIVVPVDCSDHAKNALKMAVEINKNNNYKGKITCENVYFVPQGYYKTGKSYEEFAEIMEQNTRKHYKKFVSDVEGEFSDHYSLDDDQSPADKIYEYADSINADLVLMGGKGRTFASSVLIGSVAEKLIGYDANIPLLIIKSKGEEWGFWKAITSGRV